MELRRRWIVLCALVAAPATEGVAAATPTTAHVEVCGQSTCVIATDERVLAGVADAAGTPAPPAVPPPPMQPFYALRIRTSGGTPDTAYYVPAPGILRLTVGRYGERRWVALDAPTRRAFNRTLRANAPIAAPTPLLVTIGARPAADATAYRALYGRLPSAPAPAATRPPPTKIVLTTMTPSPWSGGSTIRLAYVAKHKLLRRDGQWVRVTPSLARALERDGRIGGAGSRTSLLLVAGAVAAAVAASAAATAARRRRVTA